MFINTNANAIQLEQKMAMAYRVYNAAQKEVEKNIETQLSSGKNYVNVRLTSQVAIILVKGWKRHRRMDAMLQDIKGRDLLNVVEYSQVIQVRDPDGGQRWIFQSQRKNQRNWNSHGQSGSSLVVEIRRRNVIAHSLTVEAVYAAFNNSAIFSAIKQSLQKKLPKDSNLNQMSKSRLITFLCGVPESLLKHSIGILMR